MPTIWPSPLIPDLGSTARFLTPFLLTFRIAIRQYSSIAHMQTYSGAVKSLQLKIFPINPYYSEILMLSPLQVHCFHRPEGEGVPSMRFGMGSFASLRITSQKP